MRIALINVRTSRTTVLPLGVLYIASFLRKKGYNKIRIFDSPDSEFLPKLRDFDPEVIGMGFMSTEFTVAKKISKWIKKNLPGAKIIVGGPHATSLYRQVIEEIHADYVILGEGELAFYEVIKAFDTGSDVSKVEGIAYQEGKRIIKRKRARFIDNLDELPFPAWDLVDMSWYLLPPGFIRGYFLKRPIILMTSRGCPGRCTFCQDNIFGRVVRRRSPENVVSEIVELIRDYSIDGFYFVDDTFTLDYPWIENFCQLLIKKGLIMPWGCSSRVNTISGKMLSMMKRAGCKQLDFGVESGSEHILKSLKKDIKIKQIRKAFKLAKKYRMRTLANFMVGSPGETRKDITKSIRLAKQLDADFVTVSYITPYPGCDLYEKAVKNKWIESSAIFDQRWDAKTVFTNPVMSVNMSKKELVKMKKRFDNTFWFRNFKSYLYNPRFMFDVFMTIMKRPKHINRIIQAYIRSGSIGSLVDVIKGVYRYENLIALKNEHK